MSEIEKPNNNEKEPSIDDNKDKKWLFPKYDPNIYHAVGLIKTISCFITTVYIVGMIIMVLTGWQYENDHNSTLKDLNDIVMNFIKFPPVWGYTISSLVKEYLVTNDKSNTYTWSIGKKPANTPEKLKNVGNAGKTLDGSTITALSITKKANTTPDVDKLDEVLKELHSANKSLPVEVVGYINTEPNNENNNDLDNPYPLFTNKKDNENTINLGSAGIYNIETGAFKKHHNKIVIEKEHKK